MSYSCIFLFFFVPVLQTMTDIWSAWVWLTRESRVHQQMSDCQNSLQKSCTKYRSYASTALIISTISHSESVFSIGSLKGKCGSRIISCERASQLPMFEYLLCAVDGQKFFHHLLTTPFELTPFMTIRLMNLTVGGRAGYSAPHSSFKL